MTAPTTDNTTAQQTEPQPATAPAAAESITDAVQLEEHLEALAETMQKQIDLVGQDDLDTFLELGEHVSEMLRLVTAAAAPITWKSFETIKRIKTLHNQLGLTLNAKSEEMNKDLQKVRSGKNIAKAYGR